MKPQLRPNAAAFTVLELLVAATITVILAGLMLTVVVNALSSWTRSHGALEAETQARLALNQIASDLQGAVFRADGNVWLAATIQTDTGISGQWHGGNKPSLVAIDATTDLREMHFGLAAVWLRFITTHSATTVPVNQPSGPVAVSYQLVRKLPPGTTNIAEEHYMLYRTEASPAETFAGGYNLDPASATPPAYTAALRQPTALHVIADNVVDFGVRFYSREPSGAETLIFPRDAGNLTHFANASPKSATLSARLPHEVEIVMRVLTAEGVRQIRAIEEGQITGADWWAVANANSKVFTRRVQLISAMN